MLNLPEYYKNSYVLALHFERATKAQISLYQVRHISKLEINEHVPKILSYRFLSRIGPKNLHPFILSCILLFWA